MPIRLISMTPTTTLVIVAVSTVAFAACSSSVVSEPASIPPGPLRDRPVVCRIDHAPGTMPDDNTYDIVADNAAGRTVMSAVR